MMLDVFAACAATLVGGNQAAEREGLMRGQMLCAWCLLATLAALAPLWLLLHA